MSRPTLLITMVTLLCIKRASTAEQTPIKYQLHTETIVIPDKPSDPSSVTTEPLQLIQIPNSPSYGVDNPDFGILSVTIHAYITGVAPVVSGKRNVDLKSDLGSGVSQNSNTGTSPSVGKNLVVKSNAGVDNNPNTDSNSDTDANSSSGFDTTSNKDSSSNGEVNSDKYASSDGEVNSGSSSDGELTSNSSDNTDSDETGGRNKRGSRTVRDTEQAELNTQILLVNDDLSPISVITLSSPLPDPTAGTSTVLTSNVVTRRLYSITVNFFADH